MNAVELNAFVGVGSSGVVVSLQEATPANLTPTTMLTCTTDSTGTCSKLGSVAIPAGALLDIQVDNTTGASVAAVVGWFATTDPLTL